MVKVTFYNLLRSKYKVKEAQVSEGSVHQILKELFEQYDFMDIEDFKTSIVFYKGSPIHYRNFDKVIDDGEEIIFTHFVGGG